MKLPIEHLLPSEPNMDEILADIPRGQAPEGLMEGCLVVEGGAFRGLHTQGFLDAMMENGLNLSCVIGVSAGALAGANYVSGQIGRSARTNIAFRHDSRYIGAKSLLHSHSILDVGFLTEKRAHTTAQNAHNSLDLLLKNHPEVKYVAVVSGDYHVRVGVLLFEADLILRTEPGGTPPITVISNAGSKTSKNDLSQQYRAGGLIELAGNAEAAQQLYNNRYDMNKYPPLP